MLDSRYALVHLTALHISIRILVFWAPVITLHQILFIASWDFPSLNPHTSSHPFHRPVPKAFEEHHGVVNISSTNFASFLFIRTKGLQNNLKEERFILAHDLRSFSLLWVDSIALRPLSGRNYGRIHEGKKLLTSS